MGFIYCITNKINGKKYIGQTKRNEVRIKEHFRTALEGNSNLHLYNSIRKYGKENFSVEILKDNLEEDELDRWEIHFIEKYNTYKNGYNNTAGGGGVRGYHHSEETKRKISLHNNPKAYTPERAHKISLAQKGRPKSVEHRRKLSEARKGKYKGVENGFFGKHHTEESNRINSEKHRKYIFKQIDTKTNRIVDIFYNIHDVSNYILKTNLSKAKPTSIEYRIYQTIYGNQKQAYGFSWIGEEV